MKVTVGIVDDHHLFVKSLTLLVNSFDNFQVIIEAMNGKDLMEKLVRAEMLPDLMLVDVNMPVLDGPETVKKDCARHIQK